MSDDCMWVFVSTFLATWFGFMVFEIRFLSKRKWVGLTDEDIDDIWRRDYFNLHYELPKVIEAKLKEKNT